MPAKVDIEAQQKFHDECLQPVIAKAKAEQCHLYFMDATHLVQGAFLGYLWCFVRRLVPTPSGRKRYNVLGAYNPITHKIETITNTTYINSASVCEMLHKLATLHKEEQVVIVLDNASYQRCKLVHDLAKQLNIELLFLPTYSPNLNLIERYWKFLKNKCLYNHY
ncbi:MAG: IS630 family transposase, partial [Planctomycetaceae bacterium]|nr:IS630 family transposase [Planctomycetaceae bacterium]